MDRKIERMKREYVLDPTPEKFNLLQHNLSKINKIAIVSQRALLLEYTASDYRATSRFFWTQWTTDRTELCGLPSDIIRGNCFSGDELKSKAPRNLDDLYQMGHIFDSYDLYKIVEVEKQVKIINTSLSD